VFCGIIYKATSPSGKKYFGKTTKSLNRRMQNHEQKSKCESFHFSNAIKKYGINNFSWDIMERFEAKSLEELNKILSEREKYWIKNEKTYLREYGYNMTLGGDGLFGLNLSGDHKRKIGNSLKGRIFTESHKNNLKIDWEITHINTGKKTDESKDKLRQKSLNVKKITCEHCQKQFTPWGISNHLKKLNITI
jgi:group I intron endonuclease